MRRVFTVVLLGSAVWCLRAAGQPPVDEPREVTEELQKVIPVLIDALNDFDVTIRANAVEGLANLGTRALPQVRSLLTTGNNQVKAEAAKVLGKMAAKGIRYADTIPLLTRAMKEGDATLRREASAALAVVVAGPLRAGSSGGGIGIPAGTGQFARVTNPGQVYDLIHRNKGKDTLDWPSAEIQRVAGADFWGSWRPKRGDIGEVIHISKHPFLTTRVYILKIGSYYAPMDETGIEVLPRK